MTKIKISAVSYLNTLPFIYGINHSEYLKNNSIVKLDYPSICAENLINNIVDISLIPIAAILKLKEHYIITDYCIGANGKVNSVLLVSDVPINNIKNIYLDYQSNTSVKLVKILADKYWKIKPNWINAIVGYEQLINNDTAGVVIGDRAIKLQKKYKYIYDLSEEWQKLTKRPFVFACWVANKKIDDEFINNLNIAFQNGINNIKNIENDIISKEELIHYLTKNISFNLDTTKKDSMNMFFEYINELKL